MELAERQHHKQHLQRLRHRVVVIQYRKWSRTMEVLNPVILKTPLTHLQACRT
jgi:hypothetical protein